jgi:hypothetical protein
VVVYTFEFRQTTMSTSKGGSGYRSSTSGHRKIKKKATVHKISPEFRLH